MCRVLYGVAVCRTTCYDILEYYTEDDSSYYRYRLPNTDGIIPSEYRDFEIPQ
jgi:hypothetical protein